MMKMLLAFNFGREQNGQTYIRRRCALTEALSRLDPCPSEQGETTCLPVWRGWDGMP